MSGDITILIKAAQAGKDEARDELYREIIKILREKVLYEFGNRSGDHTLGVDGVVNMVYMELVSLNRMEFNDRNHFINLANIFIRRILKKHREKWYKGNKSLHASDIEDLQNALVKIELESCLEQLGKEYPRLEKVFKKAQIGFNQSEISNELGISLRMVQYDYRAAKSWLEECVEGKK